jgi:hypothetical protein
MEVRLKDEDGAIRNAAKHMEIGNVVKETLPNGNKIHRHHHHAQLLLNYRANYSLCSPLSFLLSTG